MNVHKIIIDLLMNKTEARKRPSPSILGIALSLRFNLLIFRFLQNFIYLINTLT